MATLAPVIDADELLRALGGTGGAPPVAPSAASGGSAVGGARGARVARPRARTGRRRAAAARRGRGQGRRAAARRVGLDLAAAAASGCAIAARDVAACAARRRRGSERVRQLGPPDLHDLPELREYIRARRAALAGFMEQGAALALNGDVLRVIPRNDIYIRYLNDNRASIAELASELYGRTLRVEAVAQRRGGCSHRRRRSAAHGHSCASRHRAGAPARPAAPMPVPRARGGGGGYAAAAAGARAIATRSPGAIRRSRRAPHLRGTSRTAGRRPRAARRRPHRAAG